MRSLNDRVSQHMKIKTTNSTLVLNQVEDYQELKKKLQMRDHKTQVQLAPLPKQYVLSLRPRTDMFSQAVMPTGAAQLSQSTIYNMDRIPEYSQAPTIEQIKEKNKQNRNKVLKNKFSFTNQIKTMKGDVKMIDRRMNEIARGNQNFYEENWMNIEQNVRRS